MNKNKRIYHEPVKNRFTPAGFSRIRIPGFFFIMALALIVIGCDSIVDQQTEADSAITTSEMAGAFSMIQSSEITCIDPDASEYNKVSESKIVEWGNARSQFVKTVEIEYYNTLTEFVLRVKSTEMIADVLVDDESIKDFDGTIAAGDWQEFTFDLDEEWEAGDTQSFSLKVAGSGPPAEFDVDYTLLGECDTAFTCGDLVTFMYNGSEVTYGTVTGANGSCWLDRNLGAAQVATAFDDHLAYGDLFQWGRAADGHQLINRETGVPISGTRNEQSETVEPDHPDFIAGSLDWLVTPNNDLWQGVDGINNPCPVDFRLPTEAEWEAERKSWSSNDANGAFTSPLKLPVAGSRSLESGASLSGGGSVGLYWTGTVDGSRTRVMRFVNSIAGISGSSFRAFGFSVRCINEDTSD